MRNLHNHCSHADCWQVLCQSVSDGMATVGDVMATWVKIVFARCYARVVDVVATCDE